jgi:hypothetical protein
MAIRQSIVLLGDFSSERVSVHSIAEEFGFTVHQARNVEELRALHPHHSISAVLVHLGSDGAQWQHALNQSQFTLKGRVRVILCHKPELADFRSQMISAGAFYTLLLPLAAAETRQALGFVWAAHRARVHEIPSKAARQPMSHRAGAA